MGFLSYNLRFYRAELQRLEGSPVTQKSLYRARQLLRMLDDLADEGYTALHEQLESSFSGESRLRAYLKSGHAAPFSRPERRTDAGPLSYEKQDTELCCAIAQVMREAAAEPETARVFFAENLQRFCRWLGYDDRTAYIFLLRDTLLPFVFYAAQGRERIYPWLLSRKSFAALTGRQNADDEIRACIYSALEAGHTDSQTFFRFVLPRIRQTIAQYPQAEDTLSGMLAGIDAEKILVVESGCAGTFPLLLMSLDARADLRMYTAYPYLEEAFGARIFTGRYEENRLFETMASQELYFRFSAIRGGKFYVKTCTDASVKRQALAEIRAMQAAPCIV